ncbi:MAG: MarR family transcriptional regulator [Cellulomonas sp. 73-92]|uniref:DUF488 domain-containing protein n=1 Tax=Cellulomonas sp. 73-92 TaxID=1895740 RepID=UPI000926C23B|nr:DUF488 family protein [Cellulomonas sp. 73-92]OJV76460.1 MAG: MarR family transcriptional regulator [Cellulomonas sp. 73-92]
MSEPTFRIKRVYDHPAPEDGFRVLVDRLWPRGLTKERAAADLWLKDAAPSTALRVEWHHDPGRFGEFADRYRTELESEPAVAELLDLARTHGVVTLLFSAHDPELNQAAVLRDYLREALATGRGRG